MSAQKTGASMGGRIEYTRQVKPIPCDCYVCYHVKRLNSKLFCGFYNKYEPSRKACARFERIPGKNLRPKPPKKKKPKRKQQPK